MYHFNKTILTWTRPCLIAIILLCVTCNFFSCSSTVSSTTNILGAWTQESSVDAGARSGAVLFVIGDKVYICGGYNGNNNSRVYLKDLWEYDSKIDTWKRKADIPGAAGRSGATAFSANGKGYVGLGYDGRYYLNDFWSYDPASDSWTQIKNFAGAARGGAFSFTINNVGYVGTGNDDNLYYKDFYQYDALNDAWVQKQSVPKIERSNAFSFVIDNLGYVGGGTNNTNAVQDFYQYDAQGGDGLGVWNQEFDLIDDPYDLDPHDKGYTISRDQGVSFVINGKGYVVGGRDSSRALSSEIWEYTPKTKTWLKKQDFGFNVKGHTQSATPRSGGVGFSLNDKVGYVCAGNSGNFYLNDMWSYDPTAINQ